MNQGNGPSVFNSDGSVTVGNSQSLNPQSTEVFPQTQTIQSPPQPAPLPISDGLLIKQNEAPPNSKKIFTLKIIKVLIIVIILGIVGLLTINIIKNFQLKSEIDDIAITNITENSISIVWTTQSPEFSEVFYSDGSEWMPLTDIFKKEIAYDDRDLKEVEYGVFKLDKKNKYYSHHVTVRGLDPEKKYYYKIKNGLFAIDLGDQSFTTFSIAEKVNTPSPVYGSVYDERAVKNGDILLLAYITNLDGSSSQILSTVTESEKGWVLDLSGIRDNKGDDFVRKSGWLVSVKALNNKSEITTQFENDNLSPVPNIILPQIVFDSESRTAGKQIFTSLMSNQKVFAADCLKWDQDMCETKLGCKWSGKSCIAESVNTNSCGNGKCDWWETEKSCSDDCEVEEEEEPICGDNVCKDGENITSCPQDCTSSSSVVSSGAKCSWFDSCRCAVDSQGADRGTACDPVACEGGLNTFSTRLCGCKNFGTKKICDSYNSEGSYACTWTSAKGCVDTASLDVEPAPSGDNYACALTDYCGTCKYIEGPSAYGVCDEISKCLTALNSHGCTCMKMSDQKACEQMAGVEGFNCKWVTSVAKCVENTQNASGGTNQPIVNEKTLFCEGKSLMDKNSASFENTGIGKEVRYCVNGCHSSDETKNDYCEPTNVSQEGDKASGTNEPVACGQEYHSEGCDEAFGDIGCSTQEGQACRWAGEKHDCAYGFACEFDQNAETTICIPDKTNSNCNGTRFPVEEGGACSSVPQEWQNPDVSGSDNNQSIWASAYENVCGGAENIGEGKACPVMPILSVSSSVDSCSAGPSLVCSTWLNKLSNCDKYEILEHEATHYLQRANITEGATSLCKANGFSSPSIGGFSCGSRVREIGAEVRSNNSGGYVFCTESYVQGQCVGEELCGTEVYSELVTQLGGNYELVDSLFNNSCSAYETLLNSGYDICQEIVGYELAYYTNTALCRSDSVLIGVGGGDSAIPIIHRMLNIKTYAQESDGLDDQAMYSAYIEGYNVTNKVISYSPGQKVEIFDDINQDGIKQANEPILDNLEVDFTLVNDFESYDLDAGWNLIGIPMLVMDSSGNQIVSAQQLLTEWQRIGKNINHIATFRDGKWLMTTRRGDVQFGDDFDLLPGESYFIKTNIKDTVRIYGLRYDENPTYDLISGWNLINIPRPSEDLTAESLIDSSDTLLGKDIDSVSKWSSGKYNTLIKTSGDVYGYDFDIFQNAGYFVRIMTLADQTGE